jgi:hypothetical protein
MALNRGERALVDIILKKSTKLIVAGMNDKMK